MTEPSPIEIVNPAHPADRSAAAIFDFDGTLSLLRRNWQDVMIPMMVEILAATGTRETREELARHVEDFVMRLNGKQTIYQMMQLAEEVADRGGRLASRWTTSISITTCCGSRSASAWKSFAAAACRRTKLTVPGCGAVSGDVSMNARP